MGRRKENFFHLRGCRRHLAFLAITSIVIVMTWLNLLRSASAPRFVDHTLINGKVFSMSEEHATPQRNDESFLSLYPPGSPSLLDNNSTTERNMEKCDPSKATLKVFMYDLPPEFHFGLLGWKTKDNSVWPDIEADIPHYPGGLYRQHSAEYWLTLDILSSRFPERSSSCSVIRVTDSHEADVVFVPFFSSLSYNIQSKAVLPEKVRRNRLLQEKLIKFLSVKEEWKRSGGRDHVFVAHHPNSMLEARAKLGQSIFILADFGRYLPTIANVEKDVIAPYKHLVKTFVNDSAGFEDRPTLLYFQGAIMRKEGGSIRKTLFELLKDKPNVNFSSGTFGNNGIQETTQGMRSSKFCLHIAGDTPSSNRLFDAIASHCVPVIVSDDIELPYEDVLDYSEFCIFVSSSNAIKKDFLLRLVRGVTKEEWTKMWERLKEAGSYFEFQYPTRKDDAVQMVWQAVARKLATVRQRLHKYKRFSRSNVK